MPDSDSPKRLRDSKFFGAFRSKRVGLMIPLGFASGLPLLLSGDTMSAWLRTEGVDLTTIGLFSLVALPYSLKVFWAPILDRYNLPWLSRRRGWMALSQVFLLAAIGVMGSVNPTTQTSMLAGWAVMVAFFSASQDIVVDAYRTDVLPSNERAAGVAVFVAAYRVALIVAGAGALILSDFVPWMVVYWIMAGLMSIGLVATLFAPVPKDVPPRPKSLMDSLVKPIMEFFGRKNAVSMFLIVTCYKVGDAVLSHLRTPFLMDIGFERAEIGAIAKGIGMAATIGGALVGGGLVAKWGLRRSLLVFGILQAGANVFYIALAHVGNDQGLLVTAVGIDYVFGGLGTAAFVAFLMSLCNKKFTAFQYALLSSASSLLGRLLSTASGWIAENLGWDWFFTITIVAAIPALVLLMVVPIKDDGPEKAATWSTGKLRALGTTMAVLGLPLLLVGLEVFPVDVEKMAKSFIIVGAVLVTFGLGLMFALNPSRHRKD